MSKGIKNFVIAAIVCAIMIGFVVSGANAATKSNKQLINEYCKANYPGYKVKIVPEFDDRIMHRAGKHVVYVEKTVTISNGKKGGYDKYGCYSAYNKKVKKGKKVVVYCIWNPYNNYEDDVVAVVDNRMIR